ncbi:hypothetical protein IE4803_PC00465 (plasmid) [Rhizobium etli bv. phaseoli str. IE4803]|nr:hypothetical protein IE4803_PC00465 [Rhizobium etli bv. phaseoli str. IE4803]
MDRSFESHNSPPSCPCEIAVFTRPHAGRCFVISYTISFIRSRRRVNHQGHAC